MISPAKLAHTELNGARLQAARRFFAVFEAHPAEVLLAEPDSGVILLANQAARARFGRTIAGGSEAALRLPDLPAAQVHAAPVEVEGETFTLVILQHPTPLPLTAFFTPPGAAPVSTDPPYRRPAENAGLLVCDIDPSGSLLYISPALLRLLDYDAPALLGRPAYDLIHPEDLDMAVQFFDDMLAERQPALAAWRFRTARGEWLGLECWASRYQTPTGETRVMAILQDVTLRQRAEQMLWARAHLREYAADHTLNELVQQALDVTEILTDSRLSFFHLQEDRPAGEPGGVDHPYDLAQLIWSTQARSILLKDSGQTAASRTHPWTGLLAEAVQRRYPQIYNDCAAQMQALDAPAGHLLPKRLLLVPLVRQGQVVAVLGLANRPADYGELEANTASYLATVAWDIVAWKRDQAALLETSAELEGFFDSALDLLCIADANGTFRRLNREWENVLGYSLAELEGRRFVELVHPDDLPDTLEYMAALDQQGGGKNFVNRCRCKDGSYRWIEWRSVSYPDPKGQGAIILAAARDFTERKLMEQQLRAALTEKEYLLRELHHRTKNNLQVVSALLYIQSSQSANPEVKKTLLEMDNRIRTMALVHQKLYQAGATSLDLGDYLAELARMVIGSYQLPVARVSLRLNYDSVLVSADAAVACGLIVNEIVSNAIKYAFPSGRPGRITLGLRRLTGGRGPARIRLTVSDNGIGARGAAAAPTAPEPASEAKTGRLPRPQALASMPANASLGMNIIYSTAADQLGAQVTLRTDRGYAWRIVFSETRI